MPRSAQHSKGRSTLHVQIEHGEGYPMETTFTESFRIGRGTECGMRVDGGVMSREHAEVVHEGGTWLIRDLGSTNGLYVNDERVPQATIDESLRLRFGKRGPVLSFWEDEAGPPVAKSPVSNAPRASNEQGGAPGGSPSGGSYTPNESESQIINRYFDADQDLPAGERTQMIRQAYKSVQTKERRKYAGVIAMVGALLVVALIATGLLTVQNRRMAAKAEDLFRIMKQYDLQEAQSRAALDGEDSPDLLAAIEQKRALRYQAAQAYNGFIEEQNFYRKLNEEEKLIYRTARIFGESELSMPAGFVEEVKTYIEGWQTIRRQKYVLGIRRAHENGYIPLIVETMEKYGLPPEFFFLALEESIFDPKAVGTPTNYGYAKGMWQFIPSTGRTYGLMPGPYVDLRKYDNQDERHDVEKATDAAARYLLYIYSTPAQASGLLVLASYNWGEHRVIKKLKDIPESQELTSEEVIQLVMEGIPQNPDERNYWGFLNKYRERMPDETRNYVLRIFSAAVIGQDPRFFGFDFDAPLKPYLEQTSMPAP